MNESCDVSRRHALKVLVSGGLVWLSTALTETSAEAAGRWERVGAAGEFKVGVPRRVKLASGAPVFVVRQASGRWMALSTRCTHEGGELKWEAGARHFVCPLHGATFALDGTKPQRPARRPLPVFPVQVQGKDVKVESSKAGSALPSKKKRDDDEDEEREHRGRKRGDDDD